MIGLTKNDHINRAYNCKKIAYVSGALLVCTLALWIIALTKHVNLPTGVAAFAKYSPILLGLESLIIGVSAYYAYKHKWHALLMNREAVLEQISRKREPDQVAGFPRETLDHIFRYLPLADAARAGATCRALLDASIERQYRSPLSKADLGYITQRAQYLSYHNQQDKIPCDLLRTFNFKAHGPYRVDLNLLYRCRNITHLDLNGDEVTDRVLKAIVPLVPNLRAIFARPGPGRWNHLYLGDEGIRTLATGCPKLTHIELGHCWASLTSGSFVTLADHCPDLQSIDLIGFSMTSAVFLPLVSCTQLHSINFYGCLDHINPAIQAFVAIFPRLQTINLSRRNEVDNNTLQILTQYSQLHTLKLATCGGGITEIGILTLAAGCPNLKAIDLASVYNINDNALRALAQCTLLQSINVSNCSRITDAGIQALAAGCSLLYFVDLSYTYITDNGIRAFTQCEQLHTLHLEGSYVTGLGIQALAGCHNLMHLSVSSTISPASYATLVARGCEIKT